MRKRGFKYSIYFIGLILTVYNLLSVTDKKFIFILIGFTAWNLLFSIWLLNTVWYFILFFGTLITILTICFPFDKQPPFSADPNIGKENMCPLLKLLSYKNEDCILKEKGAVKWMFIISSFVVATPLFEASVKLVSERRNQPLSGGVIARSQRKQLLFFANPIYKIIGD